MDQRTTVLAPKKNTATLADDYWRFERKFYISGHSLHEIENEILLHPALFREIFNPRQVNNIYFDSHSMTAFIDNVEGVANRKKSRVRWYGETFGSVKKSVLEYKIKKGPLGRKKHFPIVPFTMERETGTENLLQAIQASDLPEWVTNEIELLKL